MDKEFLYSTLVIVSMQLIVFSVVFLDIPIARQIIGFLYFTFIPGFLILRVLKLEKFNFVEKILFSLGFSIAFLMVVGLLINEVGRLAGFSRPLSQLPLMLTLNGTALLLFFLGYRVNKGFSFVVPRNLKSVLSALPFFCLPVLSVVGAIWVNAYENNSILLFLIVSIAVLFSLASFSKKLLPTKYYPVALLMIAISLLFHMSLISNYIVGNDIPLEYYSFKITENNGQWSSAASYLMDPIYGRFNSMLSVTIFPTIYSSLLNMDATLVMKIVYPLIFAFVPLGLYQIWSTYIGKKKAFIATFLFMAQLTFYGEMLGLTRQMIAELFFVLLLFLLFNKKIGSFQRNVCFIFFSFGLVVSHYSISYIFLFFIALAWIIAFYLRKSSNRVTAILVVLFSVLVFSWYIYTSSSASFDSLLSFGNTVYNELDSFFKIESRGSMVMRGLGLESPSSIWAALSRGFAYITEFFILVGFLALITGRSKRHFDQSYVVLSSVNMLMLALLVLVPGLASTLNMERFYHILLFFLAPLCIVGAETLVRYISKSKNELKVTILLLAVIAPYFLFQTNFVYEVTGSESWSFPLSKYRMGIVPYVYYGYIDEQTVFGAKWLSENVDVNHTQIYADVPSRNLGLTSYGMIYRGRVEILSNITKVVVNGTIYLSGLNIIEGKFLDVNRQLRNTTELGSLLNNLNKIYSNGGSSIYQNSTTRH